MARRKEDYNWLDDPFNDKKDKLDNGGPNKGMLGIGCLVAVGLAIALVVLSINGLANLATAF